MKPYHNSSGPTHWIWIKGISALCDIRIPDEFPDGQNFNQVFNPLHEYHQTPPDDWMLDKNAVNDIQDGFLVWVRTGWLRHFVKQLLPKIKNKFILVTGDSFISVPEQMMPESEKIIKSDYVIHWYAQNYDGTLKINRITPIPIGIDFHTLHNKPFWGENISSPATQEQQLKQIRKQLFPVKDRRNKVYIDFAYQGMGWRRLYFNLTSILMMKKILKKILHILSISIEENIQENRGEIIHKLKNNQDVFCQPKKRTEKMG